MAYDLDQFIADTRATLKRDPGPAGREKVRANLERLLANKDFVAQTCGEDVPAGLKVLYEDKDLGFQILARPWVEFGGVSGSGQSASAVAGGVVGMLAFVGYFTNE